MHEQDYILLGSKVSFKMCQKKMQIYVQSIPPRINGRVINKLT